MQNRKIGVSFKELQVNRKLTLARKGLLLIALPFSIQLLLTLAYAGLVDRVEYLAEFQYRSKAVISGANWLMLLMSVATNSAYAYSLTNDENYRKVGKTCLNQAFDQERELRTTTPGRQLELNEFFKAANALEQFLEKIFALSSAPANKVDIAQLLSPDFKSAWSLLFDARKNFLANERSPLKVGVADLPSTRKLLKGFLFAGVIIDIAFGILLVRVYNMRIAKRLAVLRDNTVRLSKGETLSNLEPGEDEIAELDSYFNKMATDLTASKKELEESEQRLKNLIENMPIGFVTVDSHGLVKGVNARAKEMFDYDTDQVVGKGVEVLITEEGRQKLLLANSHNFSGGSQLQAELEATSARGKQMILELTLKENQFRDENIKLLAIQDITQRRAMEQLREEFLKMVSHDIRSPLTAIQLTNELLLGGAYGALTDQAKNKIEKSERSSARLLELINDLLDFEKLRSGTVELSIDAFDSASFVASAFEAVQDLAEQKELELIGPNSKLEVTGDQSRLMQVMVNLLSNAIKFSPPGNKVTVEVVARDLFVEFRVHDNGRGVPKEYQRIIFEKYKQVSQEDFAVNKGTGLGLPICKLIVEQHGGTIAVDSEPGKGSTFWFRLPIESDYY